MNRLTLEAKKDVLPILWAEKTWKIQILLSLWQRLVFIFSLTTMSSWYLCFDSGRERAMWIAVGTGSGTTKLSVAKLEPLRKNKVFCPLPPLQC